MKPYNETTVFLFITIFVTSSVWLVAQFFNMTLIRALIYSHVGLGGLAFVIGSLTLFSKKGSPLHKSTGRVFYYSMVSSVVLSAWVSLAPDHFSPTLFYIGVLSLYFLIGGKRSIQLKKSDHSLTTDKILAFTVVITSIFIISYSVIIDGRLHPLRTVFGMIGVIFGLLDLWLLRRPANIKSKWLFLHLSKMLGGYTAAVTAFFVAQNVLSSYYNWFVPTVIGVGYITYWAYKQKTFKSVLRGIKQT